MVCRSLPMCHHLILVYELFNIELLLLLWLSFSVSSVALATSKWKRSTKCWYIISSEYIRFLSLSLFCCLSNSVSNTLFQSLWKSGFWRIVIELKYFILFYFLVEICETSIHDDGCSLKDPFSMHHNYVDSFYTHIKLVD